MDTQDLGPQSPPFGQVTVVRPFQAGDVVFVELTRDYDSIQLQCLQRYINDAKVGVRIVLLDKGMRIVGKPMEAT